MDTKIYGLVSLAAAILFLGTSTVQGEDGCPDSSGGCVQKCGPQGGKCEKRWYRWDYRWTCQCRPCPGDLLLGVCLDEFGGSDEQIGWTSEATTITTSTTSTAKPITTTSTTSTVKPITMTTTSTAKPSTTSTTTMTTAAPAVTLPELTLICGSSSRTATSHPIPDPYSCKDFFLCSGRIMERMTCGYNLQFNPRTLQCRPRGEVGCELQYGTGLQISVRATSNCRVGSQSLLPDLETCTSFYVCYRGSRAKISCRDGQQFNPVTSRCEHEGNVKCRTKFH